MIVEGGKYRFDPPIKAVGFQGEGDATKRSPDLLFETGTCVKIGRHSHEFRGEVGGEEYKFFSIPEAGGSKAIPMP